MTSILQDVRYGIRMLAKSPGFTAVAVVTLALGIGANTAVFTILNAVVFRPLPYPQADRLVQLYEWSGKRSELSRVSPADLRDWQQQNTVFEQLATYQTASRNLYEGGVPEQVPVTEVGANLFPALGVRPMLGRAFLPEDTEYGAPGTVVLSEDLWRSRFGSDPGIIGRRISIDGVPHPVIGVMPSGFHFPPDDDSVQIWLPLQMNASTQAGRQLYILPVLGRLKPGVSIDQAQAEMEGIARRIQQNDPEAQLERRGVRIVPLDERVSGKVRPALLALAGAVGFVLLIVCANLANLLLARGAGRRHEVALRAALGANRGRILRQFLTEGLLLSSLGALLSVAVASGGLYLLRRLAAKVLPRLHEVRFDTSVFLFLLAVSVAAGIVFGIIPALQAMDSTRSADALKQTSRAGGIRGHHRLRQTLIASEIALSLVLLVGAGLLLKTFLRLESTNSGIAPDNVLTFQLLRHMPSDKDHSPVYHSAHTPAENPYPLFYRALLDKLSALPGVRSAGLVNRLPLQPYGGATTFAVEGNPNIPPTWIPMRHVSSDYFRTMGIPLLRGRSFDDRDWNDGRSAVLVNHTFVKQMFPNDDPLGKRLVGAGGGLYEIIGVVGDVRQAGLDKPASPEVYFFYAKAGLRGGISVVLRSPLPASVLVPQIRTAIQQIDPQQPIYKVQTMKAVVSESIGDRRLYMQLLSAFAAMALILACLGIYGVVSCSSAQRIPEFGLRLALGASPVSISRLVLREASMLIVAGTAVGVAGALAATRLIAQYLYGVRPHDFSTFLAVSLALAGVTLLASYIPARRAAKVDPMVALRCE